MVANRGVVDQNLWDGFHRLVNMSSPELRDWLRTSAAEPDREWLPDQAGEPLGRRVPRILSKRLRDLTAADAAAMRQAVARIERLLFEEAGARADAAGSDGADSTGTVGGQAWRHRLMSPGHDPLKPL